MHAGRRFRCGRHLWEHLWGGMCAQGLLRRAAPRPAARLDPPRVACAPPALAAHVMLCVLRSHAVPAAPARSVLVVSHGGFLHAAFVRATGHAPAPGMQARRQLIWRQP